jgi:hypothetical protein
MINSTFDAANFVAMVRNWDLKIYPTYGLGVVNNQAQNDFVEPGGVELYHYKEIGE